MTTTPEEPVDDPEVVPSGDPSIVPDEERPEPEPLQPGEDPGPYPDDPPTET